MPLKEGSPLTLSVEPNELSVRKTSISGELTRAVAGEVRHALKRAATLAAYSLAVLC